jgi:nitrile hydratase subunit beta
MTRTRDIPARFKVDDAVRVLDLDKGGHVRTPCYVRHKTGTVIQFCGYFLNPEELSLGNTAGPLVPAYRVRFLMRDLWPGYVRRESDVLCLEIYDHWLEAAALEGPMREERS